MLRWTTSDPSIQDAVDLRPSLRLDLRAWHDRLRPSGLQPPLAGNAVFGVAKKAVLRLLKEQLYMKKM